MANNGAINLIVSKEAQAQIDLLLKDLDLIEGKIMTISQTGIGKKAGFVDVKSQKELATALETNKQLSLELAAARKDLIATNKKIGMQANTEQSAYSKLNASQKESIATYNALMTKKAMGNKLNKDEVASLKQVELQIKKNQKAYGQIQAGQNKLGLSSKRTGVAFDSLGFSVAQLTRESPAFLNSVQTGFMALSNNIPIFVDEVDRLIKKNAILRDSGEKTASVWKTVGKAFFSMQSLISVVILAITILGPKIYEMAKGWWANATALNAVERAQKSVNDVMAEGLKNSHKETVELKILNKAVQDNTKSNEDRQAILNEMRSKYGEDIKHLSDREILTNGVGEAERILAERILARARADAAATKISENMTKILKLEEDQRTAIQDVIEKTKASDQAQQMEGTIQLSNMQGASMSKASVAATRLATSQAELIKINGDLGALYVENNKLTDIAVKGQQGMTKAIKKGKSEGKPFYLEDVDPDTVNGLKMLISYNNQLIGFSKNKDQIAKLQEENKLYQEQLDYLMGIAGIYKSEEDKVATTVSVSMAEYDRAIQEIKNLENDLGFALMDVGSALVDGIFGARIQAIDDEMEKMKEKYDLQRELIEAEVTDEASKKQRLAELEKEQRLREKELEKKKEAAEKKAFLLQQAIAVGEVIMNAAIGIAEATAMGPATFGASLSWIPLIKGIAAANIASILAQSIPAFKDGHLSGTHEGTALINDGGNVEILERRGGQLELSTQKNKLVSMQKGDKVHKDIPSFLNSLPNQSITDSLHSASILSAVQMASANSNAEKRIFDEQFKEAMLETMMKGFSRATIVNDNRSVGDAVKEALSEQNYTKKFL